MIHKTLSPKPGHVRIVFELPASTWADRIFLVGDFNDWNPTATPIYQGRDGIWRAVVDLEAGKSYEFRYLIDGRWHTDYHADGWSVNVFGSQNCIVWAVLPASTLDRPEYSSAIPESTPVQESRRPAASSSLPSV